MLCPNCKLENQTGALKCGCGYDFETKKIPTSNATVGVDNRSPKLTTKDLQVIESRLNRSFYVAVSAVILFIVINAFLSPLILTPGKNAARLLLALVILAGGFLAFAGYVWYVISIYKTAKAINKSYGLYLSWAILGPVLSLLPIPIISHVLAVTPLTIKFLLSGEIRTMARFQTMRDLH
jgi:hypothetical protein